MAPAEIDYAVYLVTDRGLSRGRQTREVVEAAVRGGATVVQLRKKTADTRDFIREAIGIKPFLSAWGIPLIINDRLDVAQAVGADGVHLGQRDMPISMARAIVGDSMIIGISAESVQDATDAEQGGADYLGVSPVFTTPTKTDTAEPLGIDGLRSIRSAVKIPLVGIGGIGRDNAADVIAAGADGVAVVSAIVSADDPEAAARDLLQIVRKARAG
jgi:thiamine-phosphate pyrophosphorylase